MFTPFLGGFDLERYVDRAPVVPYHEGGWPRNVDMYDVAEMVVWLLSDAARGCSGADYAVDAGWTAGTFAPACRGSEQEAGSRRPVSHPAPTDPEVRPG